MTTTSVSRVAGFFQIDNPPRPACISPPASRFRGSIFNGERCVPLDPRRCRPAWASKGELIPTYPLFDSDGSLFCDRCGPGGALIRTYVRYYTGMDPKGGEPCGHAPSAHPPSPPPQRPRP